MSTQHALLNHGSIKAQDEKLVATFHFDGNIQGAGAAVAGRVAANRGTRL